MTCSTGWVADAAGTSPLSTSVDGFLKGTLLFDASAERSHRFSYNVNRTGDDHQAVCASSGTGLGKGGGHVGGVLDVDRHAGSSCANFSGGCGPRVLDVGGDHTIGERKQNFANFANCFVAHGTEDEDQRTIFVGG